MLIKDNTEHCKVLSSVCLSVGSILSDVSIHALLYHFFHVLLYGSYFYTNAFCGETCMFTGRTLLQEFAFRRSQRKKNHIIIGLGTQLLMHKLQDSIQCLRMYEKPIYIFCMSNIWLFFLVQNLVLLVHFSDKCCTLKYFFITTH